MRNKSTFVAGILLVAATLSLQAWNLINIDFGAHTNPVFSTKTGQAATGLSESDYWNLYSRDGPGGTFLDNSQLLNLRLSDGTVTEADLFVRNAAGAWYTLNPDPMFESYLYPLTGSPNIDILLTNVPVGTYDVYVYAHGQPANENAIIQIQSGNTVFPSKSTSAAASWDGVGWIEGGEYVVFRNVSVQAFESLEISSQPGISGKAVVNGIQLIEAPSSEITISQQPQDQNVILTGRAEFGVTASSGLPISYQWEFNGGAIAGATNPVLVVENVTTTNAGAYRVSVSNASQTVSSSNAFLRTYTSVIEPLLNVDFGAHLNPFLRRKTGPAAVGKTQSDQWNLYSRDGANGVWLDNNQLSNLVWSDGSPSATDLAVSNASGAWYTLHSDPMFESYLYPGSRSGNISAVLSDLPAGQYDIYFYAHGQVPGENAVIELSTDSLNYGIRTTSTVAGWNTPNWSEENHFVVFSDVTVRAAEKLRILSKPGQDGLAVVNGMQLVKKQAGQNSEITISQQPQDQYVPIGNRAELSVTASSALPLYYQWFFEEDAIVGATNPVFTIAVVEASNSGVYTVRIANSVQTVERSVRLDAFVRVDRPLLNVDFGAHTNPNFRTKTGPAAVGRDGGDRWNLYSRDDASGRWIANGQLSNLVWNDGTSSTIRLSVTNAAGAWYTFNPDAMFESYLYPLSRTGNIGASLASLPIGTYDVYVYAHGQIPAENGVIALGTDSVDYGIKTNSSAANWDSNGWSEGGEYVLFTDVRIRAGEVLRATSRPGSTGLSVINGIQLVLKEGVPGQYNQTVADWTFEEGVPGETVRGAQDFSGSGNHITQVLGPSAAFLRSGAGVNGFVSVTLPAVAGGLGNALRANDSVDFNLGNEFTLEASVNPGPANADFNRGIIVGQDAGSGRLVYGLDYRSEGREVGFLIYNANAEGESIHATIPNDGKSHHVAGVFSGGVLRIYLDKQLVQSRPTSLLPGIPSGGAGRVTLGANDIGGYWFDGTLDRVRISRRALSSEEFFPHEADPSTPLTILQPLSDLTVGAGSNATFHVVATGGTNLAYRWNFNGQILSNQVTDTLILQNVREADAGLYGVTVFSGPWEASSTASLTVIGSGAGAPVITAHPLSRLAGLGLSAQFNVTSSSSTPISYQWFFNGSTIAGETNATLWIVDVAHEDAGAYYVVVSNSSGNATSFPAILNVFSSTATGGTVYLDNHRPGVDAPVTDDRGLRVTGPEFLAQLYGAASGQPVFPVGAAIPFGTGENAGYFSDPIERVVPGTTSGAEATLEVRVWDSRGGQNFDQAVANGALHGVSNPMSSVLGGTPALPAVLSQLRPFSLASGPRITRQPADVSVKSGRTAVFAVEAAGTGPLTYQWKFNTNVVLAGQTSATLVLSNITEVSAGAYSVEVRNHIGLVTSIPARLTVLPSDTETPVITLTSPAAGSTTAARVTLSGTVTDNASVMRVEWLRDGQMVGPIAFSNGVFAVANILLAPGTNRFTVRAYDEEGNIGSASVAVFFEAQRALWVGSVPAAQEGARTTVPILVNSSGDIGALSFSLSYDTDHLAEPSLDWRSGDGNSFTQVNTDQPGVIRGTYVLPGRSIRSGTNTLATVTFRARSVPESLSTPLGLEVQGVYSASGDPIPSGTSVLSGEVRILRRQIIADNNANDRLDVGDAAAIIRMLTLLDPIRLWDITGNDLNQNSLLDPGDAVRVLRAVVNIDPQPPVPVGGQLQAQAVGSTEPYISLSSESRKLVPGQQIKVRVDLGVLFAISGASFQVNYPTNALRLENADSHSLGPIVPPGAMSLWNLSLEQDYAQQSGQINFAASAGTAWPQHSGVLAELTFTVQSGAEGQRFWPISVTHAEVAAGTEVDSSASSELLLEGRDAQPVNLTVGTFNAATGAFELQLGGDSGTTYRIEASDDLRTWTPLSVTTAGSDPIRVTDSPATPAAHRFYRAVEVP